jgi:hypothetical protein
MDDLLTKVLADVAARTGGAPPSQVSSVPVTWRDGSLGCPDPGKMYTMALVPGYRVTVEAGGQTFEFHASRGGHFVLCPPDRTRDPLPDDAI